MMQVKPRLRAISLLLALGLFASSFSGCAPKEPSDSSSPDSSLNQSMTGSEDTAGISDITSMESEDIGSSGPAGSSGTTKPTNSSKAQTSTGGGSTAPGKGDGKNYGWDIGVEKNFKPKQLTTKGLKEKTVYVLEINNILNHKTVYNPDIWRMVASLQGVINRDMDKTKIAIYINFEDGRNDDMFWLDYMSGSGKFLNGYKRVTIRSLEVFLATFKNQLQDAGMILWDTKVPATANVAATACGIYNYIPVKYDTDANSLYNLLLKNGVKAKENLVGKFTGKGTIPDIKMPSTGSAKNDAYYWAAFQYMSKTNPAYVAYYVDGATTVKGSKFDNSEVAGGGHLSSLPNHDYYIANRAFFFDLSPIPDEAPCDDPGQKIGTDVDTYKKILATQCKRNNYKIVSGGGHVPWQLKYSSHNGMGKNTNLRTEEIWAELSSSYNVVSDADAAHPCWLTNASVYAKYPIPKSFPNNKPKKMSYDKNTVYLTLYVGDYDGSAWTKAGILDLWSDKDRGSRPMAWNFDPNLVNRVAPMFDYMYKHMTENDYFTTGNNGAGNLEPQRLFKETYDKRELPDGGQAWLEWNKKHYDLFNMDITGMVYGIANMNKKLLNVYEQFSPGGVFHSDDGIANRAVRYKDTMFLYCDPHCVSPISKPLNDRVNDLVTSLMTNVKRGYHYGSFRTIGYSYQQLEQLQDAVLVEAKKREPKYNYVWTDPYTLFNAVEKNGKYSRVIK